MARQMNIMIQPKELKSSNYLNNSRAGSSLSVVSGNSHSYSHERGLSRNAQTLIFLRKQLTRILKDKRTWFKKREQKENIYIPPNFSLDDFDLEEVQKQLVQKLLSKKIYDEEEHWKKAVCEDCGKVIEEKALRLHSFSRYSSEWSNVQALISVNKKKLKTILRKVHRIKCFVISFDLIPEYFKSVKQEKIKIINLFLKELRKAGIDFPSLQVLDIKFESNKNQVHFHFIAPALEQKKFDVRVWHRIRKKVIEKTGQKFTVSLDQYKSKRQVIGYFALMMSGRYTFNGKHHGSSLDEIVIPIEYLVNFWGMRSYAIRGHRDNQLMDFDNSYFEWLCSISCLTIPQICPFCQSTNIKLILSEENITYPPDPPPEPPKIAIEYIKI